MSIGLLALVACFDVHQVAGVGATYTTRCSATMTAKGTVYEASCTPEPCDLAFTSVAVGHVVVAWDVDRGVVGYAERTCVQDLRDATGRFLPPEAGVASGPGEGSAP